MDDDARAPHLRLQDPQPAGPPGWDVANSQGTPVYAMTVPAKPRSVDEE